LRYKETFQSTRKCSKGWGRGKRGSTAQHLDGLDGLIIPGGESTTIGKLAGCPPPAAAIGSDGYQVERNAFGRQVASFEIDLNVPALADVDGDNRPYHAVFIRAPLIESVSGDARVLARLEDGRIVAAQQGKLLATSFHPELTEDDRFHRYFLRLASSA
jgi:pyridoxal 5'-phosphate synthase pdxT subunit